MRIIYLTQWFEPEPNIIKGIAFVRALRAAGHEVTVVTGLPNFPSGRLYAGYRMRPVQRETIEGVDIVRLPLYPSHDRSSVRRSLNYLSFFLSAFLYCLFRQARYDLAYVYHPPITVGLAAALAGRIRRLPFVLDVQDLWPDTVAATGMAGGPKLIRTLGALCGFVYREAAAIIVQSEGMRRALIERGVPQDKLTAIRNWANIDSLPVPAIDGKEERQRFTIIYGGNLGLAQGLGTVIDAAAIIQRERLDVEIVLYGDGVDARPLIEHAAAKQVRILRFERPLPQAEIMHVFARADALLLHLAHDPLFAITIPSKTQFYLAMGRPIIAGIAGEAAKILRESGAAVIAPPGDAEALAEAIRSLAARPPEQREAMGRSGQAYYRERLSFDRGIAETLELLRGTYLGEPQKGQAAAP